ncbi:MAG: signal recognition particle-docking protein FtsY [Clostridiales bacterium]|nr:signal recognition particle-docking protein FtsY [Clostridiales bacterium]
MEQEKGLLKALRIGLGKTRSGMLGGVFHAYTGINEDLYEALEEALIMADAGAVLTGELLSKLREKVKKDRLRTADEAKNALIEIIAAQMRPDAPFLPDGEKKAVLLVVGVNGTGKTTTIGKLAHYYMAQGRSIMLAAADTFRAAASEQLGVWAERAGVPMVKHGEGADPAAVVFDAIASCKARGCDILICDTAGRLHNKKNLMNELEKMRRVIARELAGIPCRVLLVLDATTGQNAIMQVKAFERSSGVTDVVLTKLDGTAKGGMAVAIRRELHLPVRFIGIGEGIGDLQPFDADRYARALFD